MLFNSENNNEFPCDIGLEISQYLTLEDIAGATRVCRNWHQFFSKDVIWQTKLQENGFKHVDLAELKAIIPSAANCKQIFQFLKLKTTLHTSYYKHIANKTLKRVPIGQSIKNLLSEYACLPDKSLTEEGRKKRQQEFLYRCALQTYTSDVHFAAYQIFGDKHVNSPKHLTNGLSEIHLGKDDLEIKIAELCKGNELLRTSLTRLNQDELPIISFFLELSCHSGKNYVGKSETANYSSSLIPSHNKIYFFSSYRKIVNEMEIWDYGDSDGENQIQETVAIEINEKGLTLLSYDVAVTEGIYYEAVDSLNNIELIKKTIDVHTETQKYKECSKSYSYASM